jgi:hypothetical protein
MVTIFLGTWLSTALFCGHFVEFGLSVADATQPKLFTQTCPGIACPYSVPTSSEQGFANDVLSRINLEREGPTRDFPMDGAVLALPLLKMDDALQAQAQAFAELVAAQQSISNGYGGPSPGTEANAGENVGGAPGSTQQERTPR